ncbi:MAG: hypothetical protein M1814_006276 [Vezdaea aestivalis]|nr:MAG: hypothetical protein M1814_006276 [Vezdaea aestivalis]
MSQRLRGISVHGLLAAYLAIHSDQAAFPFSLWKMTWPAPEEFEATVPLLWDPSLYELLPEGAEIILEQQIRNRDRDLSFFSRSFTSISPASYTYFWLLVNTRCFYYEDPESTAHIPRHDRMILCPFIDYFNHSDVGCSVTHDSDGFKVEAERAYQVGEEVLTSYGNHSNDFLLVEYGFVLDKNKWDEAKIDSHLMSALSSSQIERLSSAYMLGNYILDENGMCYRTRAALYAQILPPDAWTEFVNGTYLEGEYASEIRAVAHRILESLQHRVSYYEEIARELSYDPAREVLIKRWSQINHLCKAARKEF